MLQDVDANQSQSSSAAELIELQPLPVETDADRLIDELFRELEPSWDEPALTTGVLPSQCQVLQPPDQPGIIKPALVAPAQELLVSYLPQANGSPTEVADDSSSVGSSLAKLTNPGNSLFVVDRFLLGMVSAALVLTVLVWVRSQIPSLHATTATTLPPQRTTQAAIDPAQAEFAAYLQRSLDLMERQSPAKQAAAVSTATQPIGALATVKSVVPVNTAQASPAAVRMTERVYIPVYQPQPPQVVSKVQLPQAPVQVSRPTLPTPASQPTSPITPAPTQTLVGVLELGARSSVLVSTNGVTQRVRVGETLGTSRWLLAEVSNQKMIIRRGGELRSISVGQKF